MYVLILLYAVILLSCICLSINSFYIYNASLQILEHCVGLHWILGKIVSINFVPDTQPRAVVDITTQLLTFEKLEVLHPVKGLK